MFAYLHMFNGISIIRKPYKIRNYNNLYSRSFKTHFGNHQWTSTFSVFIDAWTTQNGKVIALTLLFAKIIYSCKHCSRVGLLKHRESITEIPALIASSNFPIFPSTVKYKALILYYFGFSAIITLCREYITLSLCRICIWLLAWTHIYSIQRNLVSSDRHIKSIFCHAKFPGITKFTDDIFIWQNTHTILQSEAPKILFSYPPIFQFWGTLISHIDESGTDFKVKTLDFSIREAVKCRED